MPSDEHGFIVMELLLRKTFIHLLNDWFTGSISRGAVAPGAGRDRRSLASVHH